jgi:hypothetical protein
VTSEQSGADEVPNNPAGRVLSVLREFQIRSNLGDGPNRASVLVIQEILGDSPESAGMYLHLAQLRIQAESVPALMEPYASYPGYKAYYKNYHQVFDATSRLCAPAGQRAQDIFTEVDGAGWSALKYADDVLRQHSNEKPISADQHEDYLLRVQVLIQDVAGDLSLSPADRSQIVDLLRKVEQALLDVRINGTLPVQEAVAAAGAMVRLSLWERVKSRPWMRDFGAVVVGIFMGLEATANVLAIEEYFSDEPQEAVVINQHDRHGLDQQDQQNGEDQPTSPDKPPRTVRPTPTDQPTRK